MFGHPNRIEQGGTPSAVCGRHGQGRQPGRADVGEIGEWKLAAAILFPCACGETSGQAVGDLQVLGLLWGCRKVHEL